jgi:DNA repair ATPase RecN
MEVQLQEIKSAITAYLELDIKYEKMCLDYKKYYFALQSMFKKYNISSRYIHFPDLYNLENMSDIEIEESKNNTIKKYMESIREELLEKCSAEYLTSGTECINDLEQCIKQHIKMSNPNFTWKFQIFNNSDNNKCFEIKCDNTAQEKSTNEQKNQNGESINQEKAADGDIESESIGGGAEK